MKNFTSYKDAYSTALNMADEGASTTSILSYLTSQAEAASGSGSVASILLLDKNGLLRNGCSPKLPADYLKAIDGLCPDAKLGTCAAAAATGKVVITEDFYADNKWAELRHLPLALGFKGAWSMPIKTKDKKVLGTFGTYYTDNRQPGQEEIEGVELLASAVAEIISERAKTLDISRR